MSCVLCAMCDKCDNCALCAVCATCAMCAMCVLCAPRVCHVCHVCAVCAMCATCALCAICDVCHVCHVCHAVPCVLCVCHMCHVFPVCHLCHVCHVCHAVPCRATLCHIPTQPGPHLPVSHAGISVSHLRTEIKITAAPLGQSRSSLRARGCCLCPKPRGLLQSRPRSCPRLSPRGPGSCTLLRPQGRCLQRAARWPQECGWCDTEIERWMEFTGGVPREKLTETLPHRQTARERRAGTKVSNKSGKKKLNLRCILYFLTRMKQHNYSNINQI